MNITNFRRFSIKANQLVSLLVIIYRLDNHDIVVHSNCGFSKRTENPPDSLIDKLEKWGLVNIACIQLLLRERLYQTSLMSRW
jgi:hypothetical protein